MDRLTKLLKDGEKENDPAAVFTNEVDTNISQALTLLDEFHGMIEMIRDESSEMTEVSLNEFRAAAIKMKSLYKEIDDLEKVVNIIKENCDSIDKSLHQAESETNAFSLFKRTLRQAVSPGAKLQQSSTAKDSLPHVVFQTKDLIPRTET